MQMTTGHADEPFLDLQRAGATSIIKKLFHLSCSVVNPIEKLGEFARQGRVGAGRAFDVWSRTINNHASAFDI
jgi:hypothetical protein